VANEFTNLIDKVNRAIHNDRSQRKAFSTALAMQKQRIFVKGLDSNNQQIGTYGTKPISISKSKQARQTGKTYFPGGYAEYKKAIGKNPGKVILRDADQMFFDYSLQGSNNDYGLGFTNEFNFNKSIWMEEKYKKEIFATTQQEDNVVSDILSDELSKEI
jgi:hypothetical protein